MSLSFFYCSKSDNDKECIGYSVYISDDCNCDNWDCESVFILTKIEYNRLLNIQNESLEDCVIVSGKGDPLGSADGVDNSFQGYLLKLSIETCPDFF